MDKQCQFHRSVSTRTGPISGRRIWIRRGRALRPRASPSRARRPRARAKLAHTKLARAFPSRPTPEPPRARTARRITHDRGIGEPHRTVRANDFHDDDDRASRRASERERRTLPARMATERCARAGRLRATWRVAWTEEARTVNMMIPWRRVEVCGRDLAGGARGGVSTRIRGSCAPMSGNFMSFSGCVSLGFSRCATSVDSSVRVGWGPGDAIHGTDVGSYTTKQT